MLNKMLHKNNNSLLNLTSQKCKTTEDKTPAMRSLFTLTTAKNSCRSSVPEISKAMHIKALQQQSFYKRWLN